MGLRQVIKRVIPQKIFNQLSPYGHLVEAFIAQLIYRFPARDMKVIGVTGTDGKSTTCMLITAGLKSSGKSVAMLSTIAIDPGDGKLRPSPAHMTTAGVWQLLKMIKQAKKNRVEWLVMEVSSHALSQYRVWGMPFSIVVLTNVTREHLDYHGTLENYRAAKLRLFEQANKNALGFRTGIVNADDPACNQFVGAIKKSITYGLKRGEIKAERVKSTADGSLFHVHVYGRDHQIRVNLPGQHNVYNALAAIGALVQAGLNGSQIAKGIDALKSVPGRMEQVDVRTPFKVYVDYAVTPNALASALQAAGQIAAGGRILLVFGATGSRDRGKRAQMGKAAEAGASKIFLTDDETYRENPDQIRAEVKKGMSMKNVTEIADRREAIAAALNAAKAGDVVLITGLGHQKTRNMGGRDMPWSDQLVVKQILS